jgi:hypothetical protein
MVFSRLEEQISLIVPAGHVTYPRVLQVVCRPINWRRLVCTVLWAARLLAWLSAVATTVSTITATATYRE